MIQRSLLMLIIILIFITYSCKNSNEESNNSKLDKKINKPINNIVDFYNIINEDNKIIHKNNKWQVLNNYNKEYGQYKAPNVIVDNKNGYIMITDDNGGAGPFIDEYALFINNKRDKILTHVSHSINTKYEELVFYFLSNKNILTEIDNIFPEVKIRQFINNTFSSDKINLVKTNSDAESKIMLTYSLPRYNTIIKCNFEILNIDLDYWIKEKKILLLLQEMNKNIKYNTFEYKFNVNTTKFELYKKY